MAGDNWQYRVNGIVPEGHSLPRGVKRFAAAVQYHGGSFHGWQRQSHSTSVQAQLEQALSKVADSPIRLACAGRTDTGVHATNQIVHFDTGAARSPRNWLLGANANLPDAIRLHWVDEVGPGFHARFSARARSYRYIIANEPFRPALFSGLLTWHRQPLAEDLMHGAAQALLGEQDFSSFRAAGCQSSTPFRRVDAVSVWRQRSLVVVEITANAFLHHMVRNIVGTLIAIGAGEQPRDRVAQLLALRDRTRAEVTAPADGLYLVAVDYPPEFGLPALAPGPEFIAG